MSRIRIVLIAALAVLATSCADDTEPAARPPASTPPTSEPASSLLTKVERTGSLPVIVTLAVPFTPEGALPDEPAKRRQREEITEAQDELLDELAEFDVRNAHRFTYAPLLACQVDEAALRHLLTSPRVAAVQENTSQPADG